MHYVDRSSNLDFSRKDDDEISQVFTEVANGKNTFLEFVSREQAVKLFMSMCSHFRLPHGAPIIEGLVVDYPIFIRYSSMYDKSINPVRQELYPNLEWVPINGVLQLLLPHAE